MKFSGSSLSEERFNILIVYDYSVAQSILL